MTRPLFFLVSTLSLAAVTHLGACTPTSPVTQPDQNRPDQPEAPPGAAAGTCWHHNTSPAVITTVTDQIMVQPAVLGEAGRIIQPAVFRTVIRQDIVEPRRDSWIETPCPAQITPDFLASLQRALAARGYYRGAPTGRMDRSTRIALRRYQKEAGLDSSTLSLATARQLGLVAIAQ